MSDRGRLADWQYYTSAVPVLYEYCILSSFILHLHLHITLIFRLPFASLLRNSIIVLSFLFSYDYLLFISIMI